MIKIQKGTNIRNYHLVDFIGEGGYAEVWRATKLLEGNTQNVALKIFKQNTFIDFSKEIESWLRLLPHPNICPVIEGFVYEEIPVIVMPYFENGSLRRYARLNDIKLCDKVDILIGVVNGICHLHDNLIVHRDVKPENILMSHGVPLITDFGLARNTEITGFSTRNSIVGTASYMSPENLDGKIGFQSDIWSVGVVFYELLFGVRPFDDRNGIFHLIRSIENTDHVLIPEYVPDYISVILKKTINKDYKERLNNARELLLMLKNVRSKCDSDENFILFEKRVNADYAKESYSGDQTVPETFVTGVHSISVDDSGAVENEIKTTARIYNRLKQISDNDQEITNLKKKIGDYELHIKNLTLDLIRKNDDSYDFSGLNISQGLKSLIMDVIPADTLKMWMQTPSTRLGLETPEGKIIRGESADVENMLLSAIHGQFS